MNIPGIELSIVNDDNVALIGGAFITGYRKLTIDHRLAVILGSEFISMTVNGAASYFDLGHHIEVEGDFSYTIGDYTIYSSEAKAKAEMAYLSAKYSREKIIEYIGLKKSFIESNIWLANPLVQTVANNSEITSEQLRESILDSYTKSTDVLMTYI